jgi:hypothetical protein
VTEVQVRVMTWDIGSRRLDSAALAGVIREAGPDVVHLQGAPRRLRWRSQCAALARAAGLLMAAGGPAEGAHVLLVGLRVRVEAGIHAGPGSRSAGDLVAAAAAEVAGIRFVVGGTRTGLRPPVATGSFDGEHRIVCDHRDGAADIVVSAGITVLERRPGPAVPGARRPLVADLLLPAQPCRVRH